MPTRKAKCFSLPNVKAIFYLLRMETTEKIVEAYYRYVKGYFTISNVNCPGQSEIDLLAFHPRTLERLHIEVTVSISSSYSKLSADSFDYEISKKRTKQAGQRRTIGFFVERKFNLPVVLQKLREYDFKRGKYRKVIVAWDWTDDAQKQAKKHRIELKAFPDIIREISESIKEHKTYFKDDTLRTLSLNQRAETKKRKEG